MTTTAQTAAFDALTPAMRGPVIRPGDDGYDRPGPSTTR